MNPRFTPIFPIPSVEGQPLDLVDGTVLLPGLAFTADPDTGLYRLGANNAGFAAGGAAAFDFDTTRVNFALAVYCPNGTAAVPAIAFTNKTTTGLYLNTTGNSLLGVSVNGASGVGFDSATGIKLAGSNGYAIGWTNDSTITATPDIVMRHSAAKTLTIDTDGAGGALTLINVFGPLTTSGTGTFANQQVYSGGFIASATAGYYWSGRSSLFSPVDGVIQAANGAATSFTRLILGTNDGTANGASFKLNAGVIELWTGDGSGARSSMILSGLGLSTTPGGTGALAMTGKVSTYNNVTTAGWGVPAIQASARVTAVTNLGSASIATYTCGAADGSFRVSANCLVTTSTTHSFSLDCVYTDESNVSRTLVLPVAQLTGTFATSGLITNVTGAGPYESATMQIRCKANTTITIRTSSGGTFTTVVYNAEGNIQQIA